MILWCALVSWKMFMLFQNGLENVLGHCVLWKHVKWAGACRWMFKFCVCAQHTINGCAFYTSFWQFSCQIGSHNIIIYLESLLYINNYNYHPYRFEILVLLWHEICFSFISPHFNSLCSKRLKTDMIGTITWLMKVNMTVNFVKCEWEPEDLSLLL